MATAALLLLLLLSLLQLSPGHGAQTDLLLESGDWGGWITNNAHGMDTWFTQSLRSNMVYSSCHVAESDVNAWLRAPFIDGGKAKSVFVELRFTIRKCTEYPKPEMLKTCKETFDLMAYHSDGSAAESKQAENLSPEYYTKVDTVTPDIIWTVSPSNGNMSHLINTKVYKLRLRRRGVFLALRDTGTCVMLTNVKVYYLLCPRLVRNFATFQPTPAAHDAEIESVTGSCVPNAQRQQPRVPPALICKSNGEWFPVASAGQCHCAHGYSPVGNTTCRPCPENTYKPSPGGGGCVQCPANSLALAPGAAACSCRDGHYRAEDDGSDRACTKPPSAPKDAFAVDLGNGVAQLRWLPPEDPGGRTDTVYFVECHACGAGVRYHPAQTVANLSASVSGLQPVTKYTFRVYALNGVSELARAQRQAWRSVQLLTGRTKSSKIASIRMEIVTQSSVRLSWDKPHACQSDRYELKVHPQSNQHESVFHFPTRPEHLLRGLKQGATYLVKVRCRDTAEGVGQFSDAIAINTRIPDGDESPLPPESGSGGSQTKDEEGKSVNIIIGAVVAVLLCLVIVLTMIILMSRRGYLFAMGKSKILGEKSQTSNCGMLPYTTMGLGFQLPQQLKSYVDPHTYEDPGQAVQEFAKEIDASWITIDCVLGGGEFGDVCKGVLAVPGCQESVVAIKTLKPGASDKNKLDFLTEASIMGQFEDPNVISLEGVVTRSHPVMIVTEFMANGSLDAFLRSHDGELSCYQLVSMLRGIASGMRYLSDISYIHRDLAARNILVSEQLVCKVADFGLSREVEPDSSSRDGTYTTRGGKIPIRWTAPEAIHFRKFTTATDVWSFGIVMWEVMAFGERPYWSWSNQDVVAAIESGYRLPPPMDCPPAVHQLMLDCWKWNRAERPKFAQLVDALDLLLHQPELLACQPPRPIYEPPSATMPIRRFASVGQWLASVKLERYADVFYRFGVTSMELVPALTSADLVAMGICNASHQKRLLHAVHNLKLHIYEATPYSDGYMV